jgi:DNA processing protein
MKKQYEKEYSFMRNEEFNYWLSNIQNIGAKKIELLLRFFESAEGVFHASKRELEKFQEEYAFGIRMSDVDVASIINSRNAENICFEYAKLEKNGIYFVSKEDDRYPNKLRHIYGAPYALYVKGKLPGVGEKILAVVGARDCSPYGKEMAKYLSAAVAREGITIVSGLARGIDAYAHEGALTAGGITYGIMGCGIDICYPKENINLYMEMQKEGGIISEYAPGMQPFAGNFPMRNRIISGLCDGILVIEAKEKSGSLITVDMGLEQGKEIYSLPGRVTERLSTGCNNLIKMGAKLVTTPKDILEDFIPNYEQTMDEMKKNNKLLESNGKIVYASLCLEPKHIEEIALQTGLSMDLLLEQLLLLELRGFARQTMKNYYVAQD